jgi:hypothetical protein
MPEVGDGRPAGCKPAALVHPQSDSGLWLAFPASLSPLRFPRFAFPASLSRPPVNRFPRFAFPASRKSLSPLPVKECPRLSERRVPGSSPGGSTGVSRYGSAALPSPQSTHVSRPGVRRPRIATLSSPLPRTPGWADIRVNVGTTGRGVPPTAHAHARGRKPTPQTAHDHGPRPGRPVGIHHSRPRTLTRHATPCVSTFAGSRPDPTPLPPRPGTPRPQGDHRLPDPGPSGSSPDDRPDARRPEIGPWF